MAYDVFISYSSKNKQMADAICHTLEQQEVKCWIAPRDILSGTEYSEAIPVAIKAAKVFVVVFSEAASLSPWVKGEIRIAFDNNIPILPFRIDNAIPKGQLEIFLQGRHWIDATSNPEKSFEKLCSDTKCLIAGKDLEVSNIKKRKRTLFIGIAFAVVLAILGLCFIKTTSPVPQATNEIASVEDKVSKQNSANLFLKGLKYGIAYEPGKDEDNRGASYYYECGRKFQIFVQYYQTAMRFKTIDESNAKGGLDYDFKIEGSDSLNDQYYMLHSIVIGQCDIDGDEIDELIVSAQIPDEDNLMWGIAINVFKLVNGGWQRIATLNTGTNISPSQARIVGNNVYVSWMRYESKYSLTKNGFEYIDDIVY